MTFFRAPSPPEIDQGPYRKRELSEGEAQSVLADLHYHSPYHHEKGVAEFREILARDPENLRAHRGLGYECLRRDDFECAASHLQHAATHDSSDPRLHYFHAMLMVREADAQGREPENLDAIRAQLHKALALDPAYGDAYNLLAYTDSLRGNVQAALTHIRRALELRPRDERLLSNLAKYQLQAEDWAGAEATLLLLKDSADEEIASEARSNLEQMRSLRRQLTR
jgi:Flp pilus assembly protein TadD